jgi:hypothetical protein
VDSNGVVHYSDRPQPGATQIELSGAQTFGSTAARSQNTAGQSTQPPTSAAASPAPGARQQQSYRAITILAPAQQQTLWNTGGTLDVSLTLDPGLGAGHRIDLVLDGQRRNLDTTATQIALNEVYRGVHTLEAIVVDPSGSELARSAPVTFMVQQTSIQNPNR